MVSANPLIEPEHCEPASTAAVQFQLERMLSSQTFAQSEGLRRLLSYLVEEAVQGRADRIKEYTVAVDVFERGEAFDRRADPIVRVQAGRLRSKIAQFYQDQGSSDPVVIDLPKGSYVPLFRTRDVDPWPIQDSPPAPSILAEQTRRQPRWPLPAFAFLVLGCLILLLALTRFQPVRPSAAFLTGGPSVAVLPFTNIGPDPDRSSMCDGIAEQIGDDLSQVPGLRVAARTSAFLFKGRNADVREIGQRLNVRTVLEGSVRQAGDHVRITAELVSTAVGFRMWSHTSDRQTFDVLAVQREVSQAIAAELRRVMPDPEGSAGPGGVRAHL